MGPSLRSSQTSAQRSRGYSHVTCAMTFWREYLRIREFLACLIYAESDLGVRVLQSDPAAGAQHNGTMRLIKVVSFRRPSSSSEHRWVCRRRAALLREATSFAQDLAAGLQLPRHSASQPAAPAHTREASSGLLGAALDQAAPLIAPGAAAVAFAGLAAFAQATTADMLGFFPCPWARRGRRHRRFMEPPPSGGQ